MSEKSKRVRLPRVRLKSESKLQKWELLVRFPPTEDDEEEQLRVINFDTRGQLYNAIRVFVGMGAILEVVRETNETFSVVLE